jgi:type III restriction enzyme
MKTYWIAGVNNLGKFGRWEFAEFTSVFEIDSDFHKLIDSLIKKE